jgi:hypothetical protein
MQAATGRRTTRPYHASAKHACTVHLQDLPQREVLRFLDHGEFAFLQQHARGQRHGLLRAVTMSTSSGVACTPRRRAR